MGCKWSLIGRWWRMQFQKRNLLAFIWLDMLFLVWFAGIFWPFVTCENDNRYIFNHGYNNELDLQIEYITGLNGIFPLIKRMLVSVNAKKRIYIPDREISLMFFRDRKIFCWFLLKWLVFVNFSAFAKTYLCLGFLAAISTVIFIHVNPDSGKVPHEKPHDPVAPEH